MSSGRCFRAIRGWLAGCAAATGIITAYVWYIVARSGWSRSPLGEAVIAPLFPGLLVFLITCVLTGIPAAAVVWVSEKFAMRSIWFFGCVGVLMGVLSAAVLVAPFKGTSELIISVSPLFAVAGFAAGMAYWRFAGRYAGRAASGDTARKFPRRKNLNES